MRGAQIANWVPVSVTGGAQRNGRTIERRGRHVRMITRRRVKGND